jgi:hypothetical protein
MKKLAFYICCMLLNVTLYSQINQMPDEVNTLNDNVVDKEQARVVAKHFLTERMANQQMEKSADFLSLNDVTTLEMNGLPALYVFSTQDKGFVIVSADKALKPVIGYSSEGVFPEKGFSPNFDSYMETYLGQVEWVRKQPQSETPEIQAQWESYLAGEFDFSSDTTNDVGPLLTCVWDQRYPYNALCPEDTLGVNAVASCMATSMSMIMYYYRYPLQGTGVHSYTATGYGTQYVDYGATRYNWDGMLDKINDGSGQSIIAIAQLQYHAGVSINMSYGSDISTALYADPPMALKQHFGYSPLTEYIERSAYTTNWENIVVGQLDSLYPIIFGGLNKTNTDVGHSFVCDGYQVTGTTKMFHFNFGLSGLGNGYYTLSNPNGYTRYQNLIRNCYPAKDYPYGCSNKTISDANGSFEDGSSPLHDYKPDLNCTWLIDPADSVSTISLTFNAFNVDSSDSVFIYDGENEKAALLGVYTGTTIPPALNSSGNKLFLKFKTDSSKEAKGWMAEYHSVYPIYCSGMTILNSDSGSFSNGSWGKNYNNNSNCKWRIQPPDAGEITLSFNSFDLEEHDKLTVYSVGASTVLLGTFTGKKKPDPIVSPTGALLIVFNSNGYNTAAGFDASYTSTITGNEELEISTGMTLYPNPATNIISIKTNNSLQGETTICIFNMNGVLLQQEKFQSQDLIEMDVSALTKGFYLVKIQMNKGIETKKLVVQ